MPNLFALLPDELPAELTDILLEAHSLRIERIVSLGHSSPEGFWFDQEDNEFVLLLQGAARLQFEDGIVAMKPGDWINIAAHRRHRVHWTDPHEKSVWLAVFYR